MGTETVQRGAYAGLTAAQYLRRRNCSIAAVIGGLLLIGAGAAGIILRERSWGRWDTRAALISLGVGSLMLMGGAVYWRRWDPLRLLRQEDDARLAERGGKHQLVAAAGEAAFHFIDDPAADWPSHPHIARAITQYRSQRALQMSQQVGVTIVQRHIVPVVMHVGVRASLAAAWAYLGL